MMKFGFHLWMFEPKRQSKQGMQTHSPSKSNKFKQILSGRQKANWTAFRDRESADDGIHTTRCPMLEVFCKILKNMVKVGHSEQNLSNAYIQCGAPPWQYGPAYRCSHLSIVGTFWLGLVWQPPLLPWSCSEQLLAEELDATTAFRQ